MRGERLRAIACMIAGMAAFSGMDALLKVLAGHYPPLEVVALRGAASLPIILVPLLFRWRWRELRTRRWPLHLARAALIVASLWGFIYALRVLSLANAYAVFLSAPLILTALSVPLLKERVDARAWLAILAGLAGVLVMLKPHASALSTWAALGALASAVAYALSSLAVRRFTRSDSTVSVIFWTVGLITLYAALLAAPSWVPLERAHLGWVAALGILGAIGQYLLTEAFRSAPPAVVAPFEYTTLLWGIVLDRVIWHVLPALRVCAGGAVVIASGLYVIWRERAQAAQVATVVEVFDAAGQNGAHRSAHQQEAAP